VADPEFYVSAPPSGVRPEDAPTGAGTLADPFHSINHAIREVDGGGTVFLRAGQYIEEIDLLEIRGSEGHPIVVRPRGVERVTIDATAQQFRRPATQTDWKQVGTTDEFVSADRFDPTPGEGSTVISAGAFLTHRDPVTHRIRHTRLVSYDRHEDLVSLNQLWPNPHDLANDPDMLGPEVSHEWLRRVGDADVSWEPARYRPFVYMGPGIWFDEDDSQGGRRVHIRLAATSNNVAGWPDYDGPFDPRDLPLALSIDDSHVLRMRECSYFRFEHLTMRFGGTDTIRLRGCANLCFDHLTIWAGSRAIRFESNDQHPERFNDDIEFVDCVIDGGLPSWFFRSDRKDAPYRFRPAPGQPTVVDNLGYSTSGVLISSRDARTRKINIHHCEISNCHDVSAAFGEDMTFHHNWVDNINDDGLIIAGAADPESGDDVAEPNDEQPLTHNARIYRNVVTRTLTALSFAGGRAGQVYIFRNLFDLRVPTLGIRPTGQQPNQHSLRQSTFYKDGDNEGPFDLMYNTCVVLDAGGVGALRDRMVAAAFAHYRPLTGASQRRSYNNVFAAVYSQSDRGKAVAFLPPATFLGPTNGNDYHRFGTGTADWFLLATPADGPGDPEDPNDGAGFPSFADLDAYKVAQQHQESFGTDDDPQFRSFDPTGAVLDTDDLHLSVGGPAWISQADVPVDLREVDRDATCLPGFVVLRGRGCYWWPGDVLRVGVEGRWRFPRDT
jgi:hypothetical protein